MARTEKAKPAARLLVVGHRGSSGTAPENTLASFREAIDAGVNMIELDVRMTRDYHLVVIHDRTVDRTTNGTGTVWSKTLQDLKLLDAGSWFSRDFKGEQIPTLREVMDALPPKVGLNIEVKTDGDPRRERALEESLVLVLREQRMEGPCLVSSFDHRHLRRLHRLDPELALGALYHPVRDIAKRPSGIARSTGATAFICSLKQVRRRMVDDARRHRMVLGVYGVNSEEDLDRACRYGVDAVVSDFPRKIIRALRGS